MKKYLTSPYLILFILMAASLILMLNASKGDSAIMDELAHIPAGYSYVRYLDYRLNPEHPPLVKMISALPLLFQNLSFPTDKSPWTTDINGQWAAGAQFLYESNNDANQIIFLSRLGPIFLTLLLIFFVYFFTKGLIGRWWALLPAFFVAFSPNFLAHGHYVTTDIGAALGIFLSIFCFLKYLINPSRKYLFLSGITFGVAQLMKFSAVLLIPYLILIAIIHYFLALSKEKSITDSKIGFKKSLFIFYKYARSVFLIFLIGYLIVYGFYFITTLNYPIEKQINDTRTTLGSFGFKPLADLNISMAGNKLLRPIAQYLLGVLMVMQRATGGNTAYFMGEVSGAGWKSYFPMVFIMKEPLPILLIIFLALISGLWNTLKNFRTGLKKTLFKFKEYLITNFEEFSILAFVVFYWLYSLNSSLNIGFRHLIPTLPFIYILSIESVKKWLTFSPSFLKKYFRTVLVSIFVMWLAFKTVSSAPYFLSYFNELFGGVRGGYQYVTDSNFDWGQDLIRLQKWVEKNNINKIAIDYFGGGNPKYYLKDKAEYWWSARGNPKEIGIEWLAISANTLQGLKGKIAPGFLRKPQDEYLWLKNPYSPFDKAGTSIFIYKL